MITQSYTQRELLETYGDQTTLGEIFRDIEKKVKSNGQVVCLFKVDGLILHEQDELRLAGVGLTEVGLIEVESQEPQVLFQSVVQNWLVKLPEMVKQCDRLAESLKAKGPEGQMTDFVGLIDSCQLLVDSLISFDTLLAQNQWVQSNQWKNNEALLSKAIGESLGAFQKKDFVLIGDILEYDLGHSLQIWCEIFEKFKGGLSAG